MPAYFSAWNRLRNARWLDQNHPALASEIKSLPWVADGIDGTESETLQDLLYIAVDSRSVVTSIVAIPWMQDHLTKLEAEAIAWLKNFSAEGTASSVAVLVALDWLQDDIEELEVKAIQELSYIDYDDEELAALVVALSWVQDGVGELEAQAIGWVGNFSDGGVAASVVALGWMEDGIEELEVKTIQELSYIDYDDSGVASSVVGLDWIQDGIEVLEFEAINWVNNFGDMEVAASVVTLGWMEDGIEELEVKTIQELSYINYYDSMAAATVIGFPWVQDGVSEVEFKAIDRINHFGAGKVMASVVGLGWVRDGVNELEVKAVEDLSDINYYDSTVGASVVALDWVQDGILEVEANTLPALDYMNYIDSTLAASVVALPWVQDSIEAIELEVIDLLNNEAWGQVVHSVVQLPWIQDGVNELERDAIRSWYWITTNDATLTSFVVALPWVQDGLDELEEDAIDNLYWVTDDDVTLAQTVVTLPWVLDGITALENGVLNELTRFYPDSPEVGRSVVALNWVRDGIDAVEADAIDWLNAFPEADTALQIVAMPFLESLEPPDANAVESLARMSLDHEDEFQRVITHPTLRDGITDHWAKIVATLYAVARYDAPAIDQLLDPDQVTIEERVIELPLGGQTLLAVIRTSPGAERSMDILERAVTYTEQIVGAPFPARYVALLFGESVTPGAGGNYHGTHITVVSSYDVDDDSRVAKHVPGTITHETAHYFWNGYHAWLNEGLANTTTDIVLNRIDGTPIEPRSGAPCPYVSTISALEKIEAATDSSADVFSCNYDLGERLFIDLYNRLGNEQFEEGLRNLYGRLVTVKDDDTTEVEHVKAAFAEVPGVNLSTVADVIDRWYDGVVPYDISGINDDKVNPQFHSVNGRIDVAYLAPAVDGVPTTMFTASPLNGREVWLFLDYSYNVSRTQEVPLELVTYYEDGFAFKRSVATIEAKSHWAGGSWWLPVGAWSEDQWAEGTYWVHVYNEGRKLVELEYEVTP